MRCFNIRKYKTHRNNYRKKCIICYKTLKYYDKITTLDCHETHSFHTECIQKWFDYSNSTRCPYCNNSSQNGETI